MNKRPLFLKWVLTMILTGIVVFLFLLVAQQEHLQLHAITKIMVATITGCYIIATGYCGVLCWRTDNAISALGPVQSAKYGRAADIRKYLRKLHHKADELAFTANWLPYVGMGGAVLGITVMLIGSGGLHTVVDLAHAKELLAALTNGLGIAFVPTLAGIFFGPIVLSRQYFLLNHTIEYALKDFVNGEKY